MFAGKTRALEIDKGFKCTTQYYDEVSFFEEKSKNPFLNEIGKGLLCTGIQQQC